MTFLRKYTIFTLAFILSSLAWAYLPDPLLVLDARNAAHLAKNFRMSSSSVKKPERLNLTGLSDLHMMGSAQFSELGLKSALDRVGAKSAMIIDLRQESHGYLNGNAISWYGKRNAANEGKTSKTIELEQAHLLAGLDRQEKVKAYKIKERSEDGGIENAQPVEFAVHQVLSESDLADKYHLAYHRYYVQDHHAPDDKTVDKFVSSVKNVSASKWIYIHCRGGSGRTTTFMSMYDMMHNAKTVSFDDILARQLAIGGKDLQKLPAEDSYLYKDAVKRLDFLKEFYEYAKANNDNFESTWSEWAKTHS